MISIPSPSMSSLHQTLTWKINKNTITWSTNWTSTTKKYLIIKWKTHINPCIIKDYTPSSVILPILIQRLIKLSGWNRFSNGQSSKNTWFSKEEIKDKLDMRLLNRLGMEFSQKKNKLMSVKKLLKMKFLPKLSLELSYLIPNIGGLLISNLIFLQED